MKKIISVVLSLALVLAIIACEATPIVYGKNGVTKVTLASAPAYVKGEMINAADIQLKVAYDDGTDATVNAAEAGMVPAGSDYKATEGFTAFTVKYGTDTKGTVLDWDIYVPTVAVTSLEIDPAEAVASVVTGTTASSISKEGLVYTAVYDGGSKDVSLDIANGLAKWTYTYKEAKDGKSAEITVKENKDSIPVTLSSEWTVEVTADPKSVISAIELRWDDTQEFFANNGKYLDKTQTTAADATLKVVDFDIYAVMEEGEPVALNPVTSETLVKSDKDAFVEFTRHDVAQKLNSVSINTFPATVTYMYNGEVETYDTELVIEYTDDYVTKFKIEKINASAGYDPGAPINEIDFNFIATAWASSATYEGAANNLSYADFDIQPDLIQKGDLANKSVTAVEVINKDNPKVAKAVWVGATENNVTIINNAATN